MKYFIYFVICISMVITFYSCKKEKVSKKKEPTIGAADSIKAYPGVNSMTLTWKVTDPAIKKAVAFCDNGDSIVVPYNGSENMSATFTHLEDGNYSFSIYLYDAEGHRSSRAKIVAHVYGEKYIQSLSSRAVQNAIYDSGSVSVVWQEPSNDMLGTEIRYLNASSDTQYVFIQPERDSIVLKNYKPGTYFEYRTMYKPVPDAIDTFYANYTSSKTWSTFTNPLFTDKGADPWVVYKNGLYYFTYTQGGGITLYVTQKMSQLGNAQPIEVWRPPSGKNYSKNLWAPELHYIDGKWYVYFAADNGSNANHRMYVLENTSSDPLSDNWVFKGKLTDPSDEWAIDGTVFRYNGQLYTIWSGWETSGGGSQNLYIAKMSNPYTIEGNRVRISTPEYTWEKHGSPINEGPEILKSKDGNVFLIYSASGFWTDDYCLGMLSLKNGGDPLNPGDWTKTPNPVFKRNDAAGAYAPGHNGFFKSRDHTEDWIIYHARSFPNGGSTNHRNPRIQKFTWNADGTPNFGTPVKINEKILAPSGEF